MKLWIRVDAAMPRDPAIAALADELGVELPTMIGHVVTLWGVMAEHAANGDLSRVNDATLERWAGWTKRKPFAPAFRARFCDAAGVLHGWLDRQGKLMTRMERDRVRHRKDSTETPRKGAPTLPISSAEIPQSLRGNSTSTERNGTELRSKAKPSRPADAGSVVFPKADCETLHSAWLDKIGAVGYPRFRKALLPLFQSTGPKPLVPDLLNALEVFSEQRDVAPVGFRHTWNPEKFAGDIRTYLRLGKQGSVENGIPTERMRLAMGHV